MYLLIVTESGGLISIARGLQADMEKLARQYPGSFVVKEA